MSFATEVRSYADSAVEVVVEQSRRALEAAQVGLDKLQHNVVSARAVGSLTPSIDAVRGTVEPLVATALTYGAKFAGKASESMTELTKDARIAHVVRSGEALATAVIARTVGAKSAAGPAAKPATKPSATKPAATKTATTRPVATKPVKKAAPVKASTAAKSTAKTTAGAKPATATKRTAGAPKKAPAKKAPAKAARGGDSN
jgi:hypothetical protein